MAQHINKTRGAISTKQAQRAELSNVIEREEWGSSALLELKTNVKAIIKLVRDSADDLKSAILLVGAQFC